MSVIDKPKVRCNYCNHILLDNNLLEHLLLQHKNKYFKLIGNINYFNTYHPKNINETKYIIDKNLTDKLLYLYINDYSIEIEEYLANMFMDNLYEFNNIQYIENNIFIIYHNNRWIIDINNLYIKSIINDFINNVKIIIENNMMKHKAEHIFILHSILRILDFAFIYEILYNKIKTMKN
jgi:hypothetical protein